MMGLFDVKCAWLFETLIGCQLNNLGVNYNYFGPSKRPNPGSILIVQVEIFDIRRFLTSHFYDV